MRRLLVALGALLLAAPLATPLAAQSRLAPPTPALLRADAPDRPTRAPDPSLATNVGALAGEVPLDGVGRLRTPVPADPRASTFCTASRIAPAVVLTAAHCVTDAFTGALLSTAFASTVTFFGPSAVTFVASSVVVRPEWRGFFTEASAPDGRLGGDVALLGFATALPDWITTYALFAGDPSRRRVTLAGVGEFGNGDQGAVGFDGRRRWGTNRVDLYSADARSVDWNVLYTDFDDGTAAHDAWCYASALLCDAGTGATEAGIGAGDSGAPLFVGRAIAGVASFSTYLCTDDACDPSSPPLADAAVLDGYGSIDGFAGVAGNLAWIRANAGLQVTSTPEPSGVSLLVVGLLTLRRARRARRRS